LASAAARAANDSLDRCTGRLRIQDVEAHRTRFGALGTHAMTDRLVGKVRRPPARPRTPPPRMTKWLASLRTADSSTGRIMGLGVLTAPRALPFPCICEGDGNPVADEPVAGAGMQNLSLICAERLREDKWLCRAQTQSSYSCSRPGHSTSRRGHRSSSNRQLGIV